NTSLGCLFDTLSNCRNVFLRNRTTDNGRLELEGLLCIGIHGSKFNCTLSVLSTTAGLFCRLVFLIRRLGECLLVCYLRSAYVSLYVKLAQQTVYDNLQMQLAHTGNDGLAGFLVGLCTEGRILLGQFCQGLAHLLLTSLGLGFDS